MHITRIRTHSSTLLASFRAQPELPEAMDERAPHLLAFFCDSLPVPQLREARRALGRFVNLAALAAAGRHPGSAAAAAAPLLVAMASTTQPATAEGGDVKLVVSCSGVGSGRGAHGPPLPLRASTALIRTPPAPHAAADAAARGAAQPDRLLHRAE